jgi:hypothetical protein
MFAELTVPTEVRNVPDYSVEGVLKAEIGPIRLNQPAHFLGR